ncbi:hypothetical protein RRSWK_04731 [Rhodopirellula sp. SWK7]|nr:hypothetical protein RRSWK_04731 [Rhodopirellula sp. SWK7]
MPLRLNCCGGWKVIQDVNHPKPRLFDIPGIDWCLSLVQASS